MSLCKLFLLIPLVYSTPIELRYAQSSPPNIIHQRQLQSDPADHGWIKKWAAVGDSYASGIGSGNRINWLCSRYDRSYPNIINKSALLSGDQQFDFVACSGATTPQVEKQVDGQLSWEYDMVTISAGGNDADLADLLNECVYTWSPNLGCPKTIEESKRKIHDVLPARLDSLYQKVASRLSSQGKVFVTSYGLFFDESSRECDRVSLHWYWGFVNILSWRYLTVENRKDLNELVLMVNEQLRQAVTRAGPNFQLVEWDNIFDILKGRYCQPGVQEPQPDRADLLFFLDGTNEHDELKGSKERVADEINSFPNGTFEGEVARMIQDGQQRLLENTTDAINSTNPRPIERPTWVPDSWARVFHPVQKGHSLIAGKVLFEMTNMRARLLNQEVAPELTNIASDICYIRPALPNVYPIWSGNDLPSNFPKYFILTDGQRASLAEIFYRLRIMACQNICDAASIENIRPGLVRHVKVFTGVPSNGGCEYSVKISNQKEAYLYASHDGSNCFDATEQMILRYGSTKESVWVNGPAKTELYFIGIRDINSMGIGGHHDDFPDNGEHLDYLHVACRRTDKPLWPFYRFDFRLSNWDDGQDGRTLKAELDKCEKVLHTDDWRYEREDNDHPYLFRDRTAASRRAQWRLSMLITSRCGEIAIETVFQLSGGSVKCSTAGWAEVEMF